LTPIIAAAAILALALLGCLTFILRMKVCPTAEPGKSALGVDRPAPRTCSSDLPEHVLEHSRALAVRSSLLADSEKTPDRNPC
jgi:hypothetical protein